MEEEGQSKNQIQYKKKKVEETIAIQPQDLRDPKGEIKKILNQKLFKFDISLGGIVIHHKNIKRLEDRALIHDEQPYIFLPIKYNAKILKIEIGDILPGTITQVFQSHIGIQVFNIFNAIVHIQDVKNKIVQVNEDGDWIDQQTEEQWDVGTEIQFQVKNIKIEENGEFQLEGSIEYAKKTGLVSNISEQHTIEVDDEIQQEINDNMENIL